MGQYNQQSKKLEDDVLRSSYPKHEQDTYDLFESFQGK